MTFKLEDWTPVVTTPDPTVCDECGGMGEIILGDGGGYRGEATATGVTCPCSACGGTGNVGLLYEAMLAKKERNNP